MGRGVRMARVLVKKRCRESAFQAFQRLLRCFGQVVPQRNADVVEPVGSVFHQEQAPRERRGSFFVLNVSAVQRHQKLHQYFRLRRGLQEEAVELAVHRGQCAAMRVDKIAVVNARCV